MISPLGSENEVSAKFHKLSLSYKQSAEGKVAKGKKNRNQLFELAFQRAHRNTSKNMEQLLRSTFYLAFYKLPYSNFRDV